MRSLYTIGCDFNRIMILDIKLQEYNLCDFKVRTPRNCRIPYSENNYGIHKREFWNLEKSEDVELVSVMPSHAILIAGGLGPFSVANTR